MSNVWFRLKTQFKLTFYNGLISFRGVRKNLNVQGFILHILQTSFKAKGQKKSHQNILLLPNFQVCNM